MNRRELKNLIRETIREEKDDLGKYGIDSLEGGTLGDLRKAHPWIFKANIEQARIKMYDDGDLNWFDGIWKSGTFKGHTWSDGTFKGGTFAGKVWLDGEWIKGTWKGKSKDHPNKR